MSLGLHGGYLILFHFAGSLFSNINAMKMRIIVFAFCAFTFNLITGGAIAAPKIIVTEKDKVLLQEKFDKFSKDSPPFG